MALPASVPTLEGVREQVDGTCLALKSSAQQWLGVLQAGSVNADWVFNLLDTVRFANDNITAQANALGSANFAALNAYIAAQKPGYSGTYTNDVSAVMSAANAVIAWVVNNSTGINWYTLNSDGTRTPASFTSAQTAGLQTQLQALIASIV